MESSLIKEIITNLREDGGGGYNVPVVLGGNGEEKIVWFHLARDATRFTLFPFFFLHTQLHLLFQVHFTGRVHTEAQRCTNKHKRIPETSALLMGKKETICVFVLTWINCFMGCEIELATWRAC